MTTPSRSRPTGKGQRRSAARMTEAELAAFKARHGNDKVHDPQAERSRAVLLGLGVGADRFDATASKLRQRQVTDPALATLLGSTTTPSRGSRKRSTPQGDTDVVPPPTAGAVPRAKRRGVEIGPIVQSLKRCQAEVRVGSTEQGPTLSFWFDGARMLTVNEMFSIFQVRFQAFFPYKSAWKALIFDTVQALEAAPRFDGPTRLILFRRGANKIDLDSFQTVFKFAIDALRRAHVLAEDHPDLVVETIPIQQIGDPAIGIRLERLMNWTPPTERDVHQDWMETSETSHARPTLDVLIATAGRSTGRRTSLGRAVLVHPSPGSPSTSDG